MKPLLPGLFTLLAVSPSGAQIYADFTISHGGDPVGTFRAELAYDKVPRPVANFVGLATGHRPWIDNATGKLHTNTPFYDGSHFQRLNHRFVIQGGDPPGKEGMRPGYFIQDQFHPDLRHDGRYMLSMAKSTVPHSGGGQFFITLGRASSPGQLANLRTLDDKHSVFGEVISGRTLIDDFADADKFPTLPNSETPEMQITMESVVISGPSLATFDLDNPALRLPSVKALEVKPSYDPVTERYTLEWDRDFQRDYVISISSQLDTLARFRHFLSRDAQAGFVYNLTGVAGPSFYTRIVEVDYSRIPNAPANLNADGSVMVITDREDRSVSLTFDGADGGTWTDTLGNSGTLSEVSASDGQPATGMLRTIPGFPLFQANPARLLPLGSLVATFDSPAGPDGWSGISVNVSFHEPASGFVEGRADLAGGGREPLNQAFSYTP